MSSIKMKRMFGGLIEITRLLVIPLESKTFKCIVVMLNKAVSQRMIKSLFLSINWIILLINVVAGHFIFGINFFKINALEFEIACIYGANVTTNSEKHYK